jgi:predicted ATPase/class 3 adenylate cyclase
VTLVFTDVEQSTALLHELGAEAYREVLGEHRRVIRAAFAQHAGYEVDEEGDGFFFAFGSAPAAVEAAREATAGLAEGPVRVRIGVHTGEPLVDPPNYIGEDVHLAARIMSAGHGGQVLLSRSTRALVDGDVRELGEHRLKDFAEPVQIFQLGSERFPPLKTISNTNLPRPASSFVGREREVEDLLSLLKGDARLVTLTGPGGSGKTRLAIEVAAGLVQEFKAGVFWVGLSSINEPELVTETVAQVLGAKDGLAAHIGERDLLLLLDNFEQVIGAAPELAALVEACPYLRLIVTSRELLRIRGEVEYPVPPLTSPDAVTLFCVRAQAPPDKPVHELCRALDNLPLALELAAARTSVLTATQILERLAGRLDLLKGGRGVDARHETLRATIAWSHELLEPGEQQLFRRLSVFAGGCSFDSAEHVAGADPDTLQSLLDKSLLRRRNSTEGPRFWMLETIRTYALERLEASGEADELRCRHAAHFLSIAEPIGPDQRKTDANWLQLERDHDNFRAALTELAARKDGESLVRLMVALGAFHEQRGYLREGAGWADEALRLATDLPLSLQARAYDVAAMFAFRQQDLRRASELERRALAAYRDSDDDRGEARSLRFLGVISASLKEFDEAERLYEQAGALFRRLDEPKYLDVVVHHQALLALQRGDLGRARTLLEESLERARNLGSDQTAGNVLSDLGILALEECRYEDSLTLFVESLKIAVEHGMRTIVAACLRGLAAATAVSGDLESAAHMLGATEALQEQIGAEPDPYERDALAQALRPLTQRADEPEIATALAAGRKMSESDAVGYALATIAEQGRQH